MNSQDFFQEYNGKTIKITDKSGEWHTCRIVGTSTHVVNNKLYVMSVAEPNNDKYYFLPEDVIVMDDGIGKKYKIAPLPLPG